jgi:hypothetical protein
VSVACFKHEFSQNKLIKELGVQPEKQIATMNAVIRAIYCVFAYDFRPRRWLPNE